MRGEWGIFCLYAPQGMLPELPDTDVTQHHPDAEAIDIWAATFSKTIVPRGIGVYCFYDPRTGDPKYIGSGCASDPARDPSGIWLRIKTYRWPRKNRVEKTGLVSQLIRERHLLLKVWLTRSEGDARKYEVDAIAKYSPELNRLAAGHQTLETTRERIRASVRASGERRKERITYDPEAERCCTACGVVKKCADFSKHPRMALGVYNECKLCKAAKARQARMVEG